MVSFNRIFELALQTGDVFLNNLSLPKCIVKLWWEFSVSWIFVCRRLLGLLLPLILSLVFEFWISLKLTHPLNPPA
jgi:hypothetical protein